MDIVGDKNPEFWPESHCPFYNVPTGSISCYTDEMVTTLKALAASAGQPNLDSTSQELCTYFGASDSPYQVALAKRADKKYPVPGPWINGGVIQSLKNMEAGTQPSGSDSCEDNDGLSICIPAYLTKYNLDQAVLTANILTTNSIAINHLKVQTQIINNFITGVKDPVNSAKEKFAEELPDIATEISNVSSAIDDGQSVKDMVT